LQNLREQTHSDTSFRIWHRMFFLETEGL
jgi:hypothetical protein